jgi:hypothetical protein
LYFFVLKYTIFQAFIILFDLKIADPYKICYSYNLVDFNYPKKIPNNNMENILRPAIVLFSNFSSKQIVSITIIALLSLSMIMFTNSITFNNNAFAQNATNQTSSSSTALDCSTLPSKISKNAVALQNPNKDVCDLVILRQTPQIMGHNGTILNKFLAINSLVEFMKAPDNMSKNSGDASKQMVVVMGEFALLQTELKPVLLAMSKANWNVTAVHNHPILEKPPMIFVHWDTLGNLDTISSQVKEIASLDQNLSQQQQSSTGNQTSDNPLSSIGKQLGSAIGLGNNK